MPQQSRPVTLLSTMVLRKECIPRIINIINVHGLEWTRLQILGCESSPDYGDDTENKPHRFGNVYATIW
jgi:hypothetical protein